MCTVTSSFNALLTLMNLIQKKFFLFFKFLYVSLICRWIDSQSDEWMNIVYKCYHQQFVFFLFFVLHIYLSIVLSTYTSTIKKSSSVRIYLILNPHSSSNIIIFLFSSCLIVFLLLFFNWQKKDKRKRLCILN